MTMTDLKKLYTIFLTNYYHIWPDTDSALGKLIFDYVRVPVGGGVIMFHKLLSEKKK